MANVGLSRALGRGEAGLAPRVLRLKSKMLSSGNALAWAGEIVCGSG